MHADLCLDMVIRARGEFGWSGGGLATTEFFEKKMFFIMYYIINYSCPIRSQDSLIINISRSKQSLPLILSIEMVNKER